ncbi:transposase [uncultured Desulfuromonas sp.]|uniref:transposase n=1 Tax=uncultured Desulfuromonas sp. TaxID=181013 RepID=UPI00262FFF13|nr:transposase [uncultured Desulfuromonas sp.]
MPRTARILLPEYPHHIIQRGHNRQTVFADGDDYRYYLDNLGEWKERFGCKVYAFCLMTNHLHLIVEPGEDAESLSRLMKRLAGRQTRFVNRLEGRSGTLWEGRFKSSPIESNAYLLACCRYVEMNPVFAGMCDDPAAYPWSSCSSKVSHKRYAWLDDDPLYLGLGATDEGRRQNYDEFLRQSISDEEKEVILGAVRRGQLTGGKAFVDEIESRLNRRVELRGRGRPRKDGK